MFNRYKRLLISSTDVDGLMKSLVYLLHTGNFQLFIYTPMRMNNSLYNSSLIINYHMNQATVCMMQTNALTPVQTSV